MKTPRNSPYFHGKRTIALPSFLKEHVKKTSNNMSKYIRDLLREYYRIIEANCLDEDVERTFISISMSNEEQNQLVSMVKVSPHISACDLVRNMLWLDFVKNGTPTEVEDPDPVPEGYVRVPTEEAYVDYKIIGEA